MKKIILIVSVLFFSTLFSNAAPSGTYRDITGDGTIEISPNGKAIFMWIGGYSAGGMTITEEEPQNDGRTRFTCVDNSNTFDNCYYWYEDNGDVVVTISRRKFIMSGKDNGRSEMKRRLQGLR